MSCQETRDLLPAFSVDALDPEEHDVVEDHLTRCPDCRSELREYRESVAELALAFPERQPPPDLKRRLLAAADREAASTDTQSRRLRWRGSFPPFPRLSPSALVAGLALLVALSTTLWAAGLQSQLNEQRALTASLRERASRNEDRANRYEQMTAVLQAPDIQLRTLEGSQVAPNAMGRLYFDPQTGAGMMAVRSLPPLRTGRAYQLWWVRPDGKREDGGLLTWTDPEGNGYRLIQCPGPIISFRAVGLTDEPSTGSPAPTGERVLGGSL